MRTLAELYDQHKGKVSDKWALYLREYDRLFLPYRIRSISLLEIGIQNGGSLEIWSQFFANATKLVGCDINQACGDLVFSDPRISVVIGDACAEQTKNTITKQSKSFDLIIDDGSHRSTDIVKTFLMYFPLLRNGGVFIIEDLHCSYWQEFEGGLFYPHSSMSFFKQLTDLINHEHWGISEGSNSIISGFEKKLDVVVNDKIFSEIHSIEFVNSMCVIRKESKSNNELGKRVVVGKYDEVLHRLEVLSGKRNVAADQSSNVWTAMDISPVERCQTLQQSITERDTTIQKLNESIHKIYSSTSWRVSAPVRWIGMGIKTLTNLFWLLINILKLSGGFKKVLKKIRPKFEGFNLSSTPPDNNENKEKDAYIKQVIGIAAKMPEECPDFVSRAETSFDLSNCPIKAIAFYLPQFHPIAENNKWWSKGFTEWTNVSKAMPQFVGHYQPHLPGELGFYDLRLVDVQRQQIELAKQYGIHGFCYHHYWFGGKKLLDRPFNQILANPDLDFPFCLCWANENWTRRWDGRDQDVLIAQNHSPEDDLAFIADITRALKDPRYIRFNGRPILIVYRVDLLPNARETAERWRVFCRSEGIGELYLVAARTFRVTDPRPYGFDAAIEFPPHESGVANRNDQFTFINPDYEGNVYSYDEMVDSYLSIGSADYPIIKTVSPGWDNEPRKPGKGYTFFGSSPDAYSQWLYGACTYTTDRLSHSEDQPPLVFVNAWNEWGEGAHLEPDRKYGYAFLTKTAQTLGKFCDTEMQ